MGGSWRIPDPCLVLFVEFSVFIVGPSGINGSKVPIPLEPLFSTAPTHSVPPFQTVTLQEFLV